MERLSVAILFSLLTLGVSAPKVSLDLIDLLFTNSSGGETEMQLRRKLRMIIISLRKKKKHYLRRIRDTRLIKYIIIRDIL